MASMEEDNKRQNVLSASFQGGRNLLSVYKKFEDIINDKGLSFESKIPTLISIWVQLKQLTENPQGKSIDRIIDWAQSHTLNFVLHGDWTTQPEETKNSLYKVVEDFDKTLSKCANLTSRRCKKLIEVVKNPWGGATLAKILNDPDKCTKEEELTYFSSEHGYLVAMRLKKLCDSRCEDLALRFANACLRCLRSPESQNFLVVTTDDQKRYIFDIYIALLHKYKRTHDIISELKQLTLEEGLQLVHRFTNKRVELSRVWKHCSRIAELVAQFFMTAAMTKPVEEIGPVLTELLNAWVILNDKLEGVEAIPTIMRRIIQTADSAAHIYICCEVLNKKFGEKLKTFTIELYIRALTTDMNEMEKQKTRSENEKVQETSKKLAVGFLSLADLLQDHLGVSRECVLTSFSLNPTRDCLEKIEELAIACGKAEPKNNLNVPSSGENANAPIILTDSIMGSSLSLLDTGQSSQSSLNSSEIENPSTKERTLDALISIKGDAVTGSKNYDVLSAPNQVLDAETLGLSEQLCDDLAVVLSSPRYQLLSWVLDWAELKSTCDTYLSNVQGTRNTVKELKYLNIDYNQFKDWPSDEERQQYGGIEKGYEQWADEEHSNASDYPLIYGQSNDSDCSSSTTRGRPRRKTTRGYSSESDYESVERKVDSHGSDIDTASQDADSLGSDGLQQVSNDKKGRKKSNSGLHFAMIMNAHNQANSPTANYNSGDMISIFARLDEQNGGKQTIISKPSYVNPPLQPFLLPEKRSSDPNVLKNLRMFRAKKRRDVLNSKLAKLTNMPHMNPRVLLDRQDFNNYVNKSFLKPNVKQELANFVKKRDLESSENKPFTQNNNSKVNMNPCVILDRYDDIQNMYKMNKHSLNKIPCLSDSIRERKKRKLDVLADVPGLNTLEMIRPAVIQPTIQVVQLTTNHGNQPVRVVKTQASSSNVTNTVSNTITSTPVTAHIQRVGQPRASQDNKVTRTPEDNMETENTSQPPSATISSVVNCNNEPQTSTSAGNSSTAAVISTEIPSSEILTPPKNSTQTSQATPTLVNILSQQIIRPAQQNIVTTNRSPTLINILSQQIIRPPLSQSVPIVCVSTSGLQSNILSNTTSVTSTVTTQAQNSLKLVTTNSSQHQILQQLFNNQGKNNSQVLKNVNLVTGLTNTPAAVDSSRLVQFICKTDGKMIQLTPYSANSNIKLQTIDSSKLAKAATSTVPTTKTVTTLSLSPSPVSPPIPARSGYEENYAKFIQTTGKTPPKNAMKEATTTSESTTEQANSLPKFQQAFGKAVYQSSSTVDPATAVAINNTNTVNVSLHGGSLVTTSQTNVTAAGVNSITVNPQHLQLTTTQIKNSTNIPTATATVAAIPIVGANKATVAPLGVQAIQGGVIYTRQVPVSLAVTAGQTINLISNANVAQAGVGRNQVFRITSATTGDQIKDTVIRSKMSALLAAALQSGVPNRSVVSNVVSGITTTTTVTSPSPNTESTIVYSQSQQDASTVDSEVCEVDSSSNDSCHTTGSNTNTTSTLVTPMRITLPMMQRTPGPNGLQGTRIVRPVLQIPGTMIRNASGVRQQVVLTSAQPVPLASSSGRSQTQPIGDNLVAHNSMEPMVSSTTLEQLREFDLVLEQVKERSTVQPATGQPTIRTQVQTQVQGQAQTEKPTATTSVINQTSDLQEVISNVSVSYMNQSQISQKVSSCASVVVVTSYCNIQPAASPALSVTSQSSSSPCVTPAPSSSGSMGKTVPKATSKSPKSKTVKTTTTHTSKASPVPKPQQKPQEDEQTTQRIFDILAEYAEQLRNSPDLNNKPAPRRRSNPPTNPSQNSKRKKNSGAKKTAGSHCNSMASDLSPGADDPRTIGSEDSSCGVVQISVQDSPSQGATTSEDHQSTQGSTDFSSIRSQQTESNEGTNDVIENQLPTTGRQFIFTDSNTNQSRNVIIADSTVNEALGKISNTAAVIVPANYIAVVSGNSKILATVPARSGSNQMLLFQSFVNQARKPVAGQANIKSIKYSTLQPLQGISSQALTGVTAQPVVIPAGSDTSALTQTITIKNDHSESTTVSESDTIPTSGELLLNVGTSNDISSHTTQADASIGTIKNDDAKNSSTVTPHLVAAVKNGEPLVTQLDHPIKVLPLCSEPISIDSEDKTVEKSQNNTVSSNTSFAINFAPKTSPTVLNQTARTPVIEKNINSIQDTNTSKKMNTTGLPTLGEKSTVVRTVIENQTTAKNLAASSDMAFSQMECTTSVEHFTKVKPQTNTNGPMLSQTESNVNHDIIIAESSKENVHEKVPRELDDSTTISTPYAKPKPIKTTQRTEKELQQVQQRKQAALERELHLQKSLSEECEDLGVDEPSTSDLFPEADLLFDSNNSPSFDQLSQDADKRYSSGNFQMETSCSSNDEDYKKTSNEKNLKGNNTFLMEPHGSKVISTKKETITSNISLPKKKSPITEKRDDDSSEKVTNLQQSNSKEKEPAITLFSDEDNSNSTLRADLLFGNLDYPSTEVEFDYEERSKMRQMTNCSKDGITLQSSTSNYSVSSYDEHTLLTTCASIMEVCSPIHYDIHSDSPPPIHKYKYKYCNRKKMMNVQNTSASKSPEKMEADSHRSWHHNADVIDVLSSDDETSGSATPDRAKSSASRSPSPTNSNKKRNASPTWDEDEEHDDDDSNASHYKSIYNASKIIKLSVEKLVQPICANQQKAVKLRRNTVAECTLDSSVVSTTPPSPLSPSDGEMGTFGIGRGTRRSTQRLKKNCPCCTPPEKPKKRAAGSIKKLAKGQFNKKR